LVWDIINSHDLSIINCRTVVYWEKAQYLTLNLQVRVNGPDAAPLYKFLKASKPGLFGSRIKWNFTKFLVDKNGKVINRYATATTPFSFEVFSPPSLPYLVLFSYTLVSNLQKDIQKALEGEHIPARSGSQKAPEGENIPARSDSQKAPEGENIPARSDSQKALEGEQK
jgi:hypothetical protein